MLLFLASLITPLFRLMIELTRDCYLEIWSAKDCLDLLPSSLNVRQEADIIDALTVKLPNLGVNILPLQYKQVKDPMEVIKMAITNQSGAYMNVDELTEVAKLLGLNSREEICSVQEVIAREAAVAGDLQLVYDLCLALARKGHGLVWDLCAAIARGPAIEGMDVKSRKQLLSFSLCHCDDESIGDLLLAWEDSDMQSQTESLMILTGTAPGYSGHGSESMYAELSEDEESRISKTKDMLSKVAKDIHIANGASWDEVLRWDGKVLSFANLQLPWLVELSCESKFGKDYYPSPVPGMHYVSVRTQAVITILSWLAKHGFAPRDDLLSSIAKAIMEPPVVGKEDVIGCSFLLNLIDAFHGVEVIEEQLRTREEYQETCSIMNVGMIYSTCSIMNVGMIYSLLHNSGTECKDPHQRRELLLSKLQEKVNADDLDKVNKTQSTFWRGWKLRLVEQKRTTDHTKMLDEWSCTSKDVEFDSERKVSSQSDASSSRLKHTVVALKTTEHAASISAHMEITADDLLTIDSAVSCFMKFCEAAETRSHFDALLSILSEWETLFLWRHYLMRATIGAMIGTRVGKAFMMKRNQFKSRRLILDPLHQFILCIRARLRFLKD